WRVWWGGIVTMGSWPSASSWARRRASSLSVLRLVCLNFQASLAVLATLQATPRSAQRSWTQPARVQASMTTTAGRWRSKSLVSSWRQVVSVSKWAWAAARAEGQATLLNLARSMARMRPVAVVAVFVRFVLMVQAPWGYVVRKDRDTFHDTTAPTACMDSFGEGGTPNGTAVRDGGASRGRRGVRARQGDSLR